MTLIRWTFAAAVMTAMLLPGSATAQTLRCEVADISKYGSFVRGSEEDDIFSSLYSIAVPTDTTMTDYVRDLGGQWPLDLKPHAASAVDLVLDTVKGPYRVHLDISIKGQPFREYQEQGIAKAIQRAKADPAAKPTTENATEPSEDDENVSALKYQRSDVVQKLAGYLRSQNTTTGADPEELQWMVSQWLPGGRLLIATPKFGLRYVHAISLCRLIAGDDLGDFSCGDENGSRSTSCRRHGWEFNRFDCRNCCRCSLKRRRYSVANENATADG